MKTLIIICVAILFMCSGCGDQILELKKVSGLKNTFELKGVYFRVFNVNVTEISEPNNNLPNQVWRIKAARWVAGSRFRITIPEIPSGFVQVAPKPPEHFQLHKGRFYKVEIGNGGLPSGKLRWAAE